MEGKITGKPLVFTVKSWVSLHILHPVLGDTTGRHSGVGAPRWRPPWEGTSSGTPRKLPGFSGPSCAMLCCLVPGRSLSLALLGRARSPLVPSAWDVKIPAGSPKFNQNLFGKQFLIQRRGRRSIAKPFHWPNHSLHIGLKWSNIPKPIRPGIADVIFSRISATN